MTAAAGPYVLIVEDHPIVAQSLTDCIGGLSSLPVVVADTLDRARRLVRSRGEPALLISDLGLPDSQGEATLEGLREVAAMVPFIVFSAFDDQTLRQAAGRHGVAHYFLKSSSIALLQTAVRQLLGGAMSATTPSPVATARIPPGPLLTARQQGVMEELVCGRSNREIAQRLGVGEETVRSHVKEILGRLGVRNRTEGVAVYLKWQEGRGRG